MASTASAGRGARPAAGRATPLGRRRVPPGDPRHAHRSTGVSRGLARAAVSLATVCAMVGAAVTSVEVAATRPALAAGEPPCVDATLAADGAAAVYPLDDASGTTAADVTANQRAATIVDAASYDSVPGPLACAPGYGSLGFNGTTSAVSTPLAGSDAAVTGGGLTVVAWVRASSFAGTGTVVADADPSSSRAGFDLAVAGGGGAGAFTVGAATTGTATWHQTLAAGTWYMLAGTYDAASGTVTSYVDGQAAGSGAASGPVAPAPGAVTIGEQPATGGSHFAGQVGDVAVLPGALDASQVQSLYLAGTGSTTPPCADPTEVSDGAAALYPLDETGGPTAADVSGHSRTATIAHAASYGSTPGPLGCAAAADGALGFDGSSTSVTTPIGGSSPTVAGADLTVVAWVQPAAAAGGGTVVADTGGDGGSGGFRLSLAGGGGSWVAGPAGGGPGASWSGAGAGTGAGTGAGWTMVAGTYGGGYATAYVDGVAVATAPAGGPVGNGTGPVTIGAEPGGGGFFSGRLADVAVLPTALGAAQIAGLYRAGAGSSEPAAWSGPTACGRRHRHTAARRRRRHGGRDRRRRRWRRQRWRARWERGERDRHRDPRPGHRPGDGRGRLRWRRRWRRRRGGRRRLRRRRRLGGPAPAVHGHGRSRGRRAGRWRRWRCLGPLPGRHVRHSARGGRGRGGRGLGAALPGEREPGRR